jgi:hypothetical protein
MEEIGKPSIECPASQSKYPALSKLRTADEASLHHSEAGGLVRVAQLRVPILQRLLYHSATVQFPGHGCLSSPCLGDRELPGGKENNETPRMDKRERPHLEATRSKENARSKHR